LAVGAEPRFLPGITLFATVLGRGPRSGFSGPADASPRPPEVPGGTRRPAEGEVVAELAVATFGPQGRGVGMVGLACVGIGGRHIFPADDLAGEAEACGAILGPPTLWAANAQTTASVTALTANGDFMAILLFWFGRTYCGWDASDKESVDWPPNRKRHLQIFSSPRPPLAFPGRRLRRLATAKRG
jgi:hypothetical protein